ncbi:MAG: cupin, partial [Chloroflexi bacterium]
MSTFHTKSAEAVTQRCQVVRPDESYQGLQGLNYFIGVSAQSVGAQHLCMHLLKLPPGARAKAHLHEDHESAVYLLSGEVEMLHGDKLQYHTVVHAGEFVYIPAGVPHLPMNKSQTEAIAVLART